MRGNNDYAAGQQKGAGSTGVSSDFDTCQERAFSYVERHPDAQAIQVSGLKVNVDMDSRWEEIPPTHICHYMVLTGDGKVLDLAPRQFGHTEKVRQMTMAEVEAEWESVYLLDHLS